MSWSERYLNWAWFLIPFFAAPFIGGIAGFLLALGIGDPALIQPATFIIGFVVITAITVWYLKRKNRSLGNLVWLIVPFGMITLLCLKNLSDKQTLPVANTEEEKHEIGATESEEEEYKHSVWEIYRREWERIKQWERTLEEQKGMLKNLRTQLEFAWKPLGIVESITIYW